MLGGVLQWSWHWCSPVYWHLHQISASPASDHLGEKQWLINDRQRIFARKWLENIQCQKIKIFVWNTVIMCKCDQVPFWDGQRHQCTNRGATRCACSCPRCWRSEPRRLNWDQPGRNTKPPTPSVDGPCSAGDPPYRPETGTTRKWITAGRRPEGGVSSPTRIMWPVEMSMLDWAGSSLQDGVELCVEDGLCWGPSLNWEETLLTRDVSVPLRPPAPAEPTMLAPPTQSWRHREDLDAICCRHSSCEYLAHV